MNGEFEIEPVTGNVLPWRQQVEDEANTCESSGKVTVAGGFDRQRDGHPNPPGPEEFTPEPEPS